MTNEEQLEYGRMKRAIARLANEFVPPARFHQFGPTQIYLRERGPGHGYVIEVSSGEEENHGGTISIAVSPLGKSVRVYRDGVELT